MLFGFPPTFKSHNHNFSPYSNWTYTGNATGINRFDKLISSLVSPQEPFYTTLSANIKLSNDCPHVLQILLLRTENKAYQQKFLPFNDEWQSFKCFLLWRKLSNSFQFAKFPTTSTYLINNVLRAWGKCFYAELWVKTVSWETLFGERGNFFWGIPFPVSLTWRLSVNVKLNSIQVQGLIEWKILGKFKNRIENRRKLNKIYWNFEKSHDKGLLASKIVRKVFVSLCWWENSTSSWNLLSHPFPCGKRYTSRKMEVESDNKTVCHKSTVSSPVKFWAFGSGWKSVQ